MNDVLIVLTARCGSERYPNKMIAEINGAPLVRWVIERFLTIGARFVLATTKNKEDDVLESIGKETGIPVWRHPDPDDVVGRIDSVYKAWYPDVKFVFRALGDCPFYATELLKRSVYVMRKFKGETFSWMLPPESLPLYGAREFPYHVNAWSRIARFAEGSDREHVDNWYCENRERFAILYHEPPGNTYFRTYRVEVDYEQDIEFVRQVAMGPGMLASLSEIVRFLDDNPEVAKLNSSCVEKTGPLVSYSHGQRRGWFYRMRGKPVIDWDNNIWQPPSEKAIPVFCNSGRCLVGHGWRGTLHTKEGHQLKGLDWVNCKCGAGRRWTRT